MRCWNWAIYFHHNIPYRLQVILKTLPYHKLVSEIHCCLFLFNKLSSTIRLSLFWHVGYGMTCPLLSDQLMVSDGSGRTLRSPVSGLAGLILFIVLQGHVARANQNGKSVIVCDFENGDISGINRSLFQPIDKLPWKLITIYFQI